MTPRKRLLVLIGGIILFVAITLVLFLTSSSSSQPDNLELLVAPSASTLTLDGKSVKAGWHKVSEGKHTVKASMKGFASTEQTVTVGKEATSVRLLLAPNSEEGQKYLRDNPSERYLAEHYDALNFYDESAKNIKDNPILEVLPYTASNNTYRIDAGAAKTDSSKVPIYITGKDATSIESAKNWITTAGYTLSSLDVTEYIEPLLNKLPYKTTDYTIQIAFSTADGKRTTSLTILIFLSGADRTNPEAATESYKQAALNYLRSVGANPGNYKITYTVR